MTNEELQKLFNSLTTTNNNIFDIYIELEKLKNDYKNSDFYKETKMSIIKAYEFYFSTVGRIDYLLGLFKNIKFSELTDIMDIIANNLNLESLTNDMSKENKELFTQLLKQL